MKYLPIQTSQKNTGLIFRNNHKGFSLIELMIALAMIGILCAIIVPDMGRWKAKYTFRGITGNTLAALKYARSSAINLNTPILFNISDGGYSVIVQGTGSVLQNGDYGSSTKIANNTIGSSTLFNQRGIPSNPGSFNLISDYGFTSKTITLFITGGATND